MIRLIRSLLNRMAVPTPWRTQKQAGTYKAKHWPVVRLSFLRAKFAHIVAVLVWGCVLKK